MTTTREVLLAIKTRLTSEPNYPGDRFIDSTVFITAEDRPPAGANDTYALIIPGSADLPHRRSGVSLVRLKVRIVIYKRSLADRAGSDESRMTNSTEGLLAYLETMETSMSHSWLASTLISPMTCIGMEPPSRVQSQDGAGWLRGSREFEMTYDPGIPLTQTNNAGSAAADKG